MLDILIDLLVIFGILSFCMLLVVLAVGIVLCIKIIWRLK